jgi:predicted nucleic acid-binding protein
MADELLIDTDVLIDALRGRAKAIEYLDSLAIPLLVSAITVAELYAGVRDGGERTKLEAFARALQIVPVDRDVAIRGGLHRRDFGKSHGVSLNDALIAASAESRQVRLVTLNKKHHPMLADVVVPY